MKRVLWITPSILPSSGGQAMHSLGYIRALSKVCELKVIARATLGELKQVESDSSMFQGLDVTLVRAYKSNSKFNKVRQPISKWISHNSGVMVPYTNIVNTIKDTVKNFEPDIVVIDYIGMYNYYTLTKKICPRARFIYISHNVEFKNFIDIKANKAKKSVASNYWTERRKKYEEKMKKTLASLESELATIRAGRANPNVLNKIMVDYYGTPTPLQQVGNISVPEARMIVIQPWEKSLLKAIEKAILTSDLGINPTNDGTCIRLVFPELTEERRKELAKDVKKKGEGAKVAIRNIRRDANDTFKKMEKGGEISEDDQKLAEEKIQKLTDKMIEKVDKAVEVKTKEIMTV